MKGKVVCWMLVILFVTVVVFPGLIMIAGYRSDQNTAENRVLAEMPEFSLSRFSEYPEQFDLFVNDHFPFRVQLTSAYSLMGYLLQSSLNENVILGDDGWLFYNNINDGAAFNTLYGRVVWNEERIVSAAEWLQEKADRLKSKGIDFLVLIPPDKERIYAEKLQRKYGEASENRPVKQLLEYIENQTDVRMVYLLDALQDAKRERPEDTLYYKLDTHWNDLGAYFGVSRLAEELGIDPFPPVTETQVIYEESEQSARDLADMMGIGKYLGRDRIYSVHGYSDSPEKEKTSWDYIVTNEDFYGSVRTENDEGDSRKLLVIRDSFGTAMIPYFATKFQQTVQIHQKSFSWSDIEKEEPDIVIYEIVERSLPVIDWIPEIR